MSLKIVFLDSYSIGSTDLSAIFACGECVCYEDTTSNQIVERSIGADVIITNKVKVMKAEISALKPLGLKLICVAATGVNNVDVEYARSCGIEVRNVPAYSTESVAEATLSFVLALLRNVGYYDNFVKSGLYGADSRCFNLERPISEVRGKRWGIIAMGNIGQRVAEIASVLGAQVVYYSTSGKNLNASAVGTAGIGKGVEVSYTSVSLTELLKTSDIVTIHAPLNDATRGLIGYPELCLMRSSAILVNVGRGGIIAEDSLAQALDEGLIAGAALDVFVNEPLESDSPLLKVRDKHKLIFAPHCGWASAEARDALVSIIAKNISTFFPK